MRGMLDGHMILRDAGFDPVIVGGLEKGREFDYRSKLFVKPMTAKELREALGLAGE